MVSQDSLPLDLKNCASFKLSDTGLSTATPKSTASFRDHAAVQVLERLANALSENEGFLVTEVRPAKGIDAGFSCELAKRCKLSILLGVSERKNGIICFDLITEWYAPVLGRLVGRRAKLDGGCIRRWQEFLVALNRQLDEMGAQQTVWLTNRDAIKQWGDPDPGNGAAAV